MPDDVANIGSAPPLKHQKSMTKSAKTVLERLTTKLLILMLVNVVVTSLSMLILALLLDMGYFGGSMDLVVSNLCLFLSFGFNNTHFTRVCKCCVVCSHRC